MTSHKGYSTARRNSACSTQSLVKYEPHSTDACQLALWSNSLDNHCHIQAQSFVTASELFVRVNMYTVV